MCNDRIFVLLPYYFSPSYFLCIFLSSRRFISRTLSRLHTKTLSHCVYLLFYTNILYTCLFLYMHVCIYFTEVILLLLLTYCPELVVHVESFSHRFFPYPIFMKSTWQTNTSSYIFATFNFRQYVW